MVLRLDPRYPLVWRTPSSLQVGIDPARVVLDGVEPGTERLLAALISGTSLSGLTMLAGGKDPGPLVKALDSVLEDSPDPPAARILVTGTGPTAALSARLLDELGLLAEPTSAKTPTAALLVSHYAVPTADRGSWLRRDIPHLSIVFTDTGVLIGPIVEPGTGPCLTCVEHHHRDRDAAWPAIASQLLGRTSAVERGPIGAEAAACAVRMLVDRVLSGVPGGPTATVVRIDDDGTRTEQLVERHPQCACSSELAGAAGESDAAAADGAAAGAASAAETADRAGAPVSEARTGSGWAGERTQRRQRGAPPK